MRTPSTQLHALLVILPALLGSGCQANPAVDDETSPAIITAPAERAGVGATLPVDTRKASPAYAKALPAVDAKTDIAVLLPLQGKLSGAGIAIQRGMLAAWFSDRAAGLPVPRLRFVDSAAGDLNATYDAVVGSGADLVIGPLDKEQLRLLQQREKLPVPTLALNYADAGDGAEGLFYFGLAAEDEAAQVARHMVATGFLRPAVLFPAGEWGQRVAQTFTDTLRGYGGSVPASATYQPNSDYGAIARTLLDVADSENRHARLQRVLGISLAFSPAARQDIDSIFLVGNTTQATQLAPAIRYQHAERIPLFATSHVNGQISTAAANDLAGLRFIEMPWIAAADLSLRSEVQQAWPDIDDRYTRLYALGVDALRAIRQLPVLAGGGKLDGMTGRLTMSGNHSLRRELDWLEYRDGVAVPVTNDTY